MIAGILEVSQLRSVGFDSSLHDVARSVGFTVTAAAALAAGWLYLRPISWTHLRFDVGEPGTVTLTAAAQSWAKKVKAPGRISFWLKSPPAHYVVRAQAVASNAHPRSTFLDLLDRWVLDAPFVAISDSRWLYRMGSNLF